MKVPAPEGSAPLSAASEESAARHRDELAARLGPGAPARVFFSPGRVNLMGAHLDYNGGPVMPTAIDRGTLIAVRPRSDRRVRMASLLESGTAEVSLDAPPRERGGTWADYPLGVLAGLVGADPRAEGGAGGDVVGPGPEAPGVDLFFGGDLPIGAGLSSSASICVGTALALDRIWELGLSAEAWVRVALFAEREFVGVRCGIMDPYAVGLSRPGHLLWLDCKDASTRHLPFDSGLRIAVADTGVRRELAQGAFNQRVDECRAAFDALRHHAPEAECLRDVPLAVLEEHGEALPDPVRRRARHVLEEVRRTFLAREALESGDAASFGAQMTAAHASLRDLFEVSVPELDCLVEAALGHDGVLGTRLTGAGFGGCTVIVLRKGARAGLAEHLTRAFRPLFGRAPRIGFYAGDPGPRELGAGG